MEKGQIVYSVGPKDINVERTRDQIARLTRHSKRLRANPHPMAHIDREYALWAIHDLSADLAYMNEVPA